MNISPFYLLTFLLLLPIFQSDNTSQNLQENNCKPIIKQDSLFQNALFISINEIDLKEDELTIKTNENYTTEELELILGSMVLESYPVHIFAKLVSTKKTKNITKNSTNTFCFDIKHIRKTFGKAVLRISGYKDAVRIN